MTYKQFTTSWRDAMDLTGVHQPGSSGDWTIEIVECTPEQADLERLRAAINGHRRWVPPGTYTRLLHRRSVVMTDTPDEQDDHAEAYLQARRRGGRVLIHGLGLGMLVKAMLSLDEVEHVDVVELEPDVVALVAPAFADAVAAGRLTIHLGDAYELAWPVGSRWQVVWHDIWPVICSDNLAGMARLHRRFGRRAGWQGSWCRAECERDRERWGGGVW